MAITVDDDEAFEAFVAADAAGLIVVPESGASAAAAPAATAAAAPATAAPPPVLGRTVSFSGFFQCRCGANASGQRA